MHGVTPGFLLFNWFISTRSLFATEKSTLVYEWFERRLKEMVVDSLLECSKNWRRSHPKKNTLQESFTLLSFYRNSEFQLIT